MTRLTDPLFEQRIADWLEEDPSEAPDQVLEVVLAALPSIQRRRAAGAAWRLTTMPARLAAAAVIAALAVGGAFYVTRPGQPAIGAPSQTPEDSVSPSVATSPAPSTTAETPGPTGAGLPARAGQFDDACDFGLGSATVGWISTSTALYRTEDLGETWSAVEPPGWATATAVANLFIDADTAYSFLQGSPSKIAATHDGGVTWAETAMGDEGAWPVFSFQSPSSGFLIFFGTLKTDPVRIHATTDGGLTWSGPQSATTVWGAIMPDWCVHRIPNGTLAQTHPWLDRQPLDGLVQLSRDGGLTWTERPIPAGADPRSLSTTEGGRIVVAVRPEGALHDHDLIYTSDDDGRSWQPAGDLSPGDRITQFLSATEWILIAGDASSVASTVDGGAHWSTIAGATPFSIGAVSFASPNVGWAAAFCGPPHSYPPYPPTHPDCDPSGMTTLLVQTVDGGRTWTRIGE